MRDICYLFPLTKRARLLLKLDLCFKEMLLFQEKNDYYTARWAIERLFEILQLIERVEIKMELYKEGERFPQEADLQHVLLKLRDYPGKVGECLRNDLCLMALQKRFFQTAGACVFDAPSLHSWLSLEPHEREADWQRLNAPLYDLQKAITELMKTYEKHFNFKKVVASNGLLHHQPQPNSSLLCVKFSRRSLIPEASFSPKAVFVKIWEQYSLLDKKSPLQDDIALEVAEF